MKSISSYDKLEELGRVQLSKSFFMRDFLHSEIAAWHQLRNVPDHPDRAIEVGRRLCEELLEPLQTTFGRIHVRSGYRSPAVNAFGNQHKLNCASNESNYAAHIWDYPDAAGLRGASACIVIPRLVEHVEQGGSWTSMAWWIHDHLTYSSLYFFPKLCAFNINWHESPKRRIDSYAAPKGCLTHAGMTNQEGSHADQYLDFPPLVVMHDRTAKQGHAYENPTPQQPEPACPLVSSDADVGFRAESIVSSSAEPRVHYRAIHTKTKWRKVDSHRSIESAISGKDGAAGLFGRRVRIDYVKHGDPVYVIAWEDGQPSGWLVSQANPGSDATKRQQIPINAIQQFEAQGYADELVLASMSAHIAGDA